MRKTLLINIWSWCSHAHPLALNVIFGNEGPLLLIIVLSVSNITHFAYLDTMRYNQSYSHLEQIDSFFHIFYSENFKATCSTIVVQQPKVFYPFRFAFFSLRSRYRADLGGDVGI